MSELRIGDQKGGLQRDQAGANAWAASRINCDCVARLSLRCALHSARAASLNERCVVRSVACCFAFRRDPHSIAVSVLTKIGIRRVFSACLYAAPLCQFFIGRFFDCQRARRHNRALLPALSNVVYWTLVLWVQKPASLPPVESTLQEHVIPTDLKNQFAARIAELTLSAV